MRPHDQPVKRGIFVKFIIVLLSPQHMAKFMGKDVALDTPVMDILDREDDDAAKPFLLADTIFLGNSS